MIPINVELGLNVNNKIEYIPLGIFNIDKVKKDDFTIKITAYDNMSKFKVPYFSSLGSTATLTQVVNEIAAKTGVQFEGNLPNYSVKKLEGFSCREILSYVASLCAGNAIIKRNGKFTILYPTDINRDIGEGVFDLQREEVKYKVGKITCKVEDKTISKGSLGADSMELQFENPWINETILVDIYNRLSGFEYLGYTLKWQGDPSLEIGDIITYKNDKGVIRKLPIFNRKLSYDGGLDSELSAKGETKNKNSFDLSGSIKKKIDRVVTELAIVNEALIDVAYIGDLTAGNIKFDTASGTIMDIQTLLAKFVTGENGQFLNLTTDNVTISNALIKDVIAKNISVEDLKASVISTNKFRIASDNGGIEIVGATQQFKDKNNKVRIQMGQDTQGNFNFILRGEDGTTTLIDHTGIKEKAIADDLIKEKMIAENAVGEKQINYSSLVTGLNKDDNTSLIQASKVAIDLTGQSLEVSFNSLKSNVDNMEIGGRNFVKDSNFLVEATSSSEAQAKPITLVSGIKLTETFLGKTVTFSYFVNCPGSRQNNTSQGSLGNRFGFHGAVTWRDSTGKLPDKGGIYPFAECLTGEYLNKRVVMSYKFNPPSGYDTIASFSFSFQPYARPTNDNNSVWKIGQPKLEIGTKATGYTEAPEDVEQKIETNTTAITVVQGQISGLISESSITKGDVITLKDNYTSIKATVDGINTTVASHTSSITNLGTNLTNAQNTANSANSLADSKAKVFTSTPTTPYKIGDIWTGGPSGEIMKCKVARSTGSYVAADWEKASKYTDDTKAVAVEGKVTIVETKQATLEQNLEGFKTTVSSTYATQTDLSTANGNISSLETRIKDAELKITSDAIVSTVRSSTAYTTDLNAKANQSALNTTNSNVTGLTTRVNTVEQKVTATAITTTISSAINAGTSSITTTQFVMDKTGFTVKNGAIKIQNKAGTNVLTSDTNGNLTITGTFVNKNSNGVDAIKIDNTNIYFYDWERSGRNLGIIYSSYNSAYPNVRGFSLGHSKLGYMTIGYESTTNTYNQYITFDKYSINPSYTAPIRVHESAVFNSAVNMQDRVYIPNTMYFGDSAATTTSKIWGAPNSNRLAIQVSVSNKDDGFMIQSNTGGVLAQILAGYTYPILLNNNTQISGNLSATGTKARLVNTKSYGGVKLNALETADALFEDIGEGTIDNTGICYIYIDPMMQETINTKCSYQVFLQKYDEGDLFVSERTENYFIVKGSPSLKFGWRLVAKQKGYETERLEQEKIIITEEFYSNIENDKEINYDDLANEYLKNYEMELMKIG